MFGTLLRQLLQTFKPSGRSGPAFVAFFLSGASSLIFQSIWSRMLHHVFGATSVAISSVVTVFMAGLGLGAWLTSRYADKIKHPIITYAIAELGVGTWALIVPLLGDSEGWLATVNGALRNSLGAESPLFMIARFACVVPILLVPTTLMGSTLPLLARHFVQSEQRAGVTSSKVGVLYAVNTLGAVAGTFLAGFLLMPNVGLAVTNVVALSLNFILAIGIFAFRRQLLDGVWKPGEKLEWLPSKSEPVAKASVDTKGEKGEKADKLEKIEKKAKKKEKEREAEVEEEESEALPIPPLARKAALFAFAASGAAALCYEVVWTRALAMTIGSSIYSFTLILATFLIGIAGGSAVASSMLGAGRGRIAVVALASIGLTFIANAPRIAEDSVGVWLTLSVACSLPITVLAFLVNARARTVESGWLPKLELPLLVMISVPLLVALVNLVTLHDPDAPSTVHSMPRIVAAVVAVMSVFMAMLVVLRRYHVLLLAIVQLFIGLATIVNYIFQDEIPYVFAHLVSKIHDLPEHVGTVQSFMFLCAGLCTLPATAGMGAMFPLTIRVWTAGGTNVGRDVGVVYTSNTIGSIIGGWLPGFVLMPWLGIERTLQIGIVLNLLLALVMLIASAAEPEADVANAADKDKGAKHPYRAATTTESASEVPRWHALTVYILSPLIPALIALLWLGTNGRDAPLSWNRSQMTLGVFRVSLASDVLNPDTWGEPDIVFYHDGLSTTVTVERWGRHFALKNNGKVDASNGDDMPTQIMVAGFPLLLHSKEPEGLDVAIIGFGSGVTVGATLEFPVGSVDVIELERAIPKASEFFADVNHLEYPDDLEEQFPYVRRERLTVINDDGRNYLASTDRTYDIIMSEPSNPWITGVSDLFTTDHFRIAKQRLREGGIYCQWVQLYEMSPENIKTIYRTFASQFAHVAAFAAEDLSSDTVLLGSDSPLPLDLERVARRLANPRIAAEMERAYVHTPHDIFARTLLSSRDEVMSYGQLEYRLRGGEWELDAMTSNGDAGNDCLAPTCRRVPAPLNTDDNAIIEFGAPRDLIGFQRYEGYLVNIYSNDWPYGRMLGHVRGFGEGDVAARNYAELAMSLIAHGRKDEAADVLDRAESSGHAAETAVAARVLAFLSSTTGEPRIAIEPPVPGPQMDEATASRLIEGFELVRASVDQGSHAAALAAMEELPSPLRMHSGPALRFLYGYLLYKAADDMPSRYSEAVDELEDLVRSEEEYVRRHPEVYYFLARAHDGDFNFDKALRNMRLYVEAVAAGGAPNDAAEPPAGAAPTTDEAGESAKDEHEDRT